MFSFNSFNYSDWLFYHRDGSKNHISFEWNLKIDILQNSPIVLQFSLRNKYKNKDRSKESLSGDNFPRNVCRSKTRAYVQFKVNNHIACLRVSIAHFKKQNGSHAPRRCIDKPDLHKNVSS